MHQFLVVVENGKEYRIHGVKLKYLIVLEF